jgi:hypothetical protein
MKERPYEARQKRGVVCNQSSCELLRGVNRLLTNSFSCFDKLSMNEKLQ